MWQEQGLAGCASVRNLPLRPVYTRLCGPRRRICNQNHSLLARAEGRRLVESEIPRRLGSAGQEAARRRPPDLAGGGQAATASGAPRAAREGAREVLYPADAAAGDILPPSGIDRSW